MPRKSSPYSRQIEPSNRRLNFGIGDPLLSAEGWHLYGRYNRLGVEELQDEIKFRKDTMYRDEFEFLTALYIAKRFNKPINPL